MTLASPYVIENIRNALEKDVNKGQVAFEKFSQRYPDDSKLIELYDKFKSRLASPRQKEIAEIKESLKQLKSSRKLESSDSIARSYVWYLWHRNKGHN